MAQSLLFSNSGEILRCSVTLLQGNNNRKHTPFGITRLGRPGGEERHPVMGLVCLNQMQYLVAFLTSFPSALLSFALRQTIRRRSQPKKGDRTTWQKIEAFVSSQTSHCGCTKEEQDHAQKSPKTAYTLRLHAS